MRFTAVENESLRIQGYSNIRVRGNALAKTFSGEFNAIQLEYTNTCIPLGAANPASEFDAVLSPFTMRYPQSTPSNPNPEIMGEVSLRTRVQRVTQTNLLRHALLARIFGFKAKTSMLLQHVMKLEEADYFD